MAFSTDDCKKLLQDSFPNIEQKNWKRMSKKKDVNGDVLREFLNKTDNSTILVRETSDTLSIEGYNFKLTNTNQPSPPPSQTIKGYYEFAVDEDTDIVDGAILLVTKKFWEKNGTLDSDGLSHKMKIPSILNETQESVFNYKGTKQEAKDILHKMGFVENQLFGTPISNNTENNTSTSQTIKGYYEFDFDPDSGEPNGSILLVTKKHWEDNGVLDDRGLSHQMKIPDVLDEIQESVFLYNCTEQEVRDVLHQIGFIENQLFGDKIPNNTQNNTPTAMSYSDFIDEHINYSHTSDFRDLLKSCDHLLEHRKKLQQLSKDNLHKKITFNDYKDLNEKVTHLLMYNVYHKDYFTQLQKEQTHIGSEAYYQYCKANNIDLLYLFLHSISRSLSIVDGKNTENFIINQNKEALFKDINEEKTTNFLVNTLQNVIINTQKDGLNSKKYDVLYEHFNHQTQYMIQTFFPDKMKRFKNNNLELARLESSLNLFKTITEDILKSKPTQLGSKMKM